MKSSRHRYGPTVTISYDTEARDRDRRYGLISESVAYKVSGFRDNAGWDVEKRYYLSLFDFEAIVTYTVTWRGVFKHSRDFSKKEDALFFAQLLKTKRVKPDDITVWKQVTAEPIVRMVSS